MTRQQEARSGEAATGTKQEPRSAAGVTGTQDEQEARSAAGVTGRQEETRGEEIRRDRDQAKMKQDVTLSLHIPEARFRPLHFHWIFPSKSVSKVTWEWLTVHDGMGRPSRKIAVTSRS